MGSYTVGAFINFVLNFFFLRGSLSLESSTGGMAYSAHSSHSDDVLSEPGSLEPFESSLLSSGRVVQEEEESLTTTTLSLSKNNLSSSVKAPCSLDKSDPWHTGGALLSEKLASISKGKDCLLNDQSGRSFMEFSSNKRFNTICVHVNYLFITRCLTMKFFIPYSDTLSSVPFLEPQPETISMSIPTMVSW